MHSGEKELGSTCTGDSTSTQGEPRSERVHECCAIFDTIRLAKAVQKYLCRSTYTASYTHLLQPAHRCNTFRSGRVSGRLLKCRVTRVVLTLCFQQVFNMSTDVTLYCSSGASRREYRSANNDNDFLVIMTSYLLPKCQSHNASREKKW